jgi:hypothetical protein
VVAVSLVDADAIDREHQTQEKLVQESVEQKKKQNEKYKEEMMEGAEGDEVSISGSKAVAGMFASSSAQPKDETPSRPPLDVQKQRQLEVLKEKMKELDLDVDEDAITRETETQERLVRRSVEGNKKQKEDCNEEMEGAEEDTDESKTNEEAQPRRNRIINMMGSVGLLPSWKEPSGDDETIEEASPQQSGESTDMPTMESSDGNEKAKIDTVADKEGKQAEDTAGKPTSGLFGGFFSGSSSNETKQQKPTVEKGSDDPIKGADQSGQKDHSHSTTKEPQEVHSGRQSEDKGAQKTAARGLLSFFRGPKGEKKETKDQAEETPVVAAEDNNAREDGTPAHQAEKRSESEEKMTDGETEDAILTDGKQSEPKEAEKPNGGLFSFFLGPKAEKKDIKEQESVEATEEQGGSKLDPEPAQTEPAATERSGTNGTDGASRKRSTFASREARRARVLGKMRDLEELIEEARFRSKSASCA